jgi:hypothetical protein
MAGEVFICLDWFSPRQTKPELKSWKVAALCLTGDDEKSFLSHHLQTRKLQPPSFLPSDWLVANACQVRGTGGMLEGLMLVRIGQDSYGFR